MEFYVKKSTSSLGSCLVFALGLTVGSGLTLIERLLTSCGDLMPAAVQVIGASNIVNIMIYNDRSVK